MTQKRRQGCVLSPLLFKVFFAAILLVALERFSEYADIIADLAHLQEQPSKVGPMRALECVRCAIWGCCMLMTHDRVAIAGKLEREMEVFIEVYGAIGLATSESKTETMCMLV